MIGLYQWCLDKYIRTFEHIETLGYLAGDLQIDDWVKNADFKVVVVELAPPVANVPTLQPLGGQWYKTIESHIINYQHLTKTDRDSRFQSLAQIRQEIAQLPDVGMTPAESVEAHLACRLFLHLYDDPKRSIDDVFIATSSPPCAACVIFLGAYMGRDVFPPRDPAFKVYLAAKRIGQATPFWIMPQVGNKPDFEDIDKLFVDTCLFQVEHWVDTYDTT